MNSKKQAPEKPEDYTTAEIEKVERLRREYGECRSAYDKICNEIRDMGELLEIPIQQYGGMRIDTILALLEKVVK